MQVQPQQPTRSADAQDEYPPQRLAAMPGLDPTQDPFPIRGQQRVPVRVLGAQAAPAEALKRPTAHGEQDEDAVCAVGAAPPVSTPDSRREPDRGAARPAAAPFVAEGVPEEGGAGGDTRPAGHRLQLERRGEDHLPRGHTLQLEPPK